MTDATPNLEVVLRVHAINGERPGWDSRRGVLYFVDMRAPSLHRLDPQTGQHDWWEMPDWIGTFALLEDGRLVVALRTGLHVFDPDAGSLRFLAAAPYDPRRFCFNDGRCDRDGRLIVGPFHHVLESSGAADEGPSEAPLWRFDGRSRLEPLPIPPVGIANGLAFSPDGRTLYQTDTPKKAIWAWDYDRASGEVENRRLFARVDEGGEIGGPDGATVDRDGFYISAIFGAGCLLRFDPDGRLERRIPLPVRYPTMPALGGRELATLYVTSSSFAAGAEATADDGALLALEAPVPGLPTSYLKPLHEQTP